jgi:hypothetical protein
MTVRAIRVYNATTSQWEDVGIAQGTVSTIETYRYTATAGQTTVSGPDAGGQTLSYEPNLEMVFLNGVRLVRGEDYTATNGNSVTLPALALGDVVEVVSFEGMQITNAVSQSSADSTYLARSVVDAKGDLVTATSADTPARLAVGSNDTILVADSAQTAGLKWASLTASQVPSLTSDKVPTVTRSVQTGSYTLVLADAGDLVEMGSGSAQTLTIPTNASVAFPVGTKIASLGSLLHHPLLCARPLAHCLDFEVQTNRSHKELAT